LPNYLFTEKAAAGLYTTVVDLTKFVRASMKAVNDNVSNKVLEAETVKLMMSKNENSEWGFGYKISDDIINGSVLVGHEGTNRGWNAQYYLIKGSNQGIVVLTNSDMGANAFNGTIAYWIKQLTGKLPGFYTGEILLQNIILYAAVVFGILIIIYMIFIGYGLYKGKRKYALHVGEALVKKILRVVTPIIVTATVWILIYAPIVHGWTVAPYLPVTIIWVVVDITVLGALMILSGFFPREKQLNIRKHRFLARNN
jgi:hypothetical protein